MPRTSYGPTKCKQAWKLVETLMRRQGSNDQVTLVQDSDGSNYLQVNASLNEMAGWSGLTIEGVREALNEHLGKKFLGIVDDQREQKAGRGAEKWQFQLKLYSTNLDENRQSFEQAWERSKSLDSHSQQQPDLPVTTKSISDSNNPQESQISIQEIRERCRQKILERHSRMRLLSGEEIGVDQLYVDVWLLEKPEHKHFNTSESLLSSYDIAKDRLAMSKRINRNPGLEIANNNSKLVILGKPGSGKTTFLKHLAVDWCKDKFQAEQIAVLIELRQIRDRAWNLIDAISQELELKEEEILSLLEQGKLFVLMDGLDEVPTDELRRDVQTQVKQVANAEKHSSKNRFILTCRTQIMKSIPRGFTSVEVADFSPEQVRQFVQNWFTANGQSEAEAIKQWENIQRVITQRPDLGELTATPVLLSLICLVWQDSGEIPTNRTKLYKKGINWLLSRWNAEKEIEGWEIGTEAYRHLNLEDKEALLIEIAARKFEDPKNFVLFEQDELVRQIAQKLQLTNAEEGIAMLKAIEAQHGLLIERADELWSFSHLTFQEYFTVQWLTQLIPQQLAEKIANQQWQGVVEQLVKSQQPADRLLRLIKQAIDQFIAQEPVIQTFLGWLLQKSDLLISNYKSAAIRAFYYSLTRDYILTRTLVLALTRALDCALDYDLARVLPRALALALALALTLDDALDDVLEHTLALDLALIIVLVRALDFSLTLEDTLGRTLALDLDRARVLALSPDLSSRLHHLKDELLAPNHSKEIQHWWSLHGAQWIEKLRQVLIEYQNIGHDWQFTQVHQQQLQRYYEANKFLVDLMKIEGAVTEACRTEIEEGLLLPWAELQRRYPHLYGELEA